jgi:hypothetical protein
MAGMPWRPLFVGPADVLSWVAAAVALAVTAVGIAWAVHSLHSLRRSAEAAYALDAEAINDYFDARERDSEIDAAESGGPPTGR